MVNYTKQAIKKYTWTLVFLHSDAKFGDLTEHSFSLLCDTELFYIKMTFLSDNLSTNRHIENIFFNIINRGYI